jgi:gliding motility-associated-like protein
MKRILLVIMSLMISGVNLNSQNCLDTISAWFDIINPHCSGMCNAQVTANISGGNPPYTFIWSNGQNTQTVYNLCQGSYSLLVLDNDGCQYTDFINIVDPPMFQSSPIFHYKNGSLVSEYIDTVCYLDSSPNIYEVTQNLMIGAHSYLWQSNIPNLNIMSGQSSNSITVDYSNLSPGLYTNAISVILIDTSFFIPNQPVVCWSTPVSIDALVLQVYPTIDTIGPFCSNDSCFFVNSSPQNGLLYGDGIFSNYFCPTDSNIGINNITYEISIQSCFFDTTVQFIVNESPENNYIVFESLDSLVEICDDVSSSVTYFTDENSYSFNWIVNGEVFTNQQNYFTVNWSNWPTGIQTVSYISQSTSGCFSDEVSIYVETIDCQITQMFVPNSFTPNSDDDNQSWSPIGRNYEEVSYKIFDRWGQLIFQSNSLDHKWDGKFLGNDCQQGVYVYKINWIDMNGNNLLKIGNLILIR